MNILLLGYGKMGKAIETVAVGRGHAIAGIANSAKEREALHTEAVDVAIEFSMPEAAPDNLRFCLDRGYPVVCGTTGWLAEKKSVEQYCLSRNGAMLYSSNFSLGVNLFFHLNEHLANLMSRYAQYTCSITESHHTQKKDAPSGTAITLAEGILKHRSSLDGWVKAENPQQGKLSIESIRQDPDPGTHTIHYSSPIDDITITHRAHTREGFAQGAVYVAEWIRDRQGIFTMKDVLGF